MVTEVRPLDPWEIAAKLIHLSNEERETEISKLTPYTFTLSDVTKVDRNESIRVWLRGYDNNEAGNVVGFLNKLHTKYANKSSKEPS